MAIGQPLSFGALLRRYRLAAGLTQEALAERAGLSVRGISDLERGANRAARPITLALLAEALALRAEERAALQACAHPPADAVEAAVDLSVGPPTTIPTNLPLALSSFVGREHELATVRRLLGETRLLTLTGAGGCGKTRLALEVARVLVRDAHQGSAFRDGIWLAELAALGDGALVPLAVATVLGVRERPGQALLDRVIAFLQSKQMLLLLDNCEHLLGSCAHVAEALLRACPQLTILATSREALNIGGEQPWRVPSLSLPDAWGRRTPERALAYEAVQLFVQRAQVARPEWTLTAPQVRLAEQVCRRLDGMPLALELAAARLATLSLDHLSQRLDDRFHILTGGSRTALPRQHTLRATLDWSYDLLGQQERLLLGRLTVFAGGWTLEAAEAICAGDGIAPEEVLDLLAGLVAKSLVLVEEGVAGTRYQLLETVRQYGGEKLAATGDAARMQDRHLDWSLALARQAEPGMGRPEQEEGLAGLHAEVENLRTALAWSSGDTGHQETGLRLAEALRWFWVVRGYLSEAQRWLEELLPGARTVAVRARALDALGEVVWQQHDNGRALALFEESAALHRQAGNGAGAAHALLAQGMVSISLGAYDQATALIAEALPLLHEHGERHGVAWALGSRGVILHLQGDYDGATALYQESLTLFQELGDKFGSGQQLGSLAWVAHEQGRDRQAQRLYHESLQARRALVDKPGCAACFEGLAVVAAAAGQPVRAARLLGAAHGLREAMLMPLESGDRAAYERAVADAHAALGDEAFTSAWAMGQVMPLDDVIAFALDAPPWT